MSSSNNRSITRALALFLSPVTGNPLYITGHAIRTAFKLEDRCSFGLFTTLRSLDGHRYPRTYRDFMCIRLSNYSPPFEVRRVCAGKKERYSIPLFYPVSVTFDVEGDHAEKLLQTGEIRLGGRRGTDHGRCKVVDTAVIDTSQIIIPRKKDWATLITPRLVTGSFPPFFQPRKVRTVEQLVIRFPRVMKFGCYPLGTIFRLASWFAPDRFLEKEDRAPSMGHGRMGSAGFGEMVFWDSGES